MSGPAERNVDGIATARFDDAVIQLYDFLRLDLPAPNGIIRLTNYPQGYSGDIDGAGVQSWNHADIVPSSLSWSQQTPQDVAWVEIWNIDNVWSTLILNYDVEFKPIQLWQAWLNVSTGALYGRPRMWAGRTDQPSISAGVRLRLTLVPARSQFAVTAPFITIATVCQNVFKEPNSCQYAGIVKPATATAADGGAGAKGAGTYQYTVTALHGTEETDGVLSNQLVLGAGKRVSLTWPASAGATGYNIYGALVGDQKLLIAPNGQNVQGTSFTDNVATGSQTRGGAPPGANGTGLATDCDHSTGACDARGNWLHFVGWPQISDRPVMWAQRVS